MRSVIATACLLAPSLAHAEMPDVNAKVRSGQRASTDAAVVVGVETYPFLPEVPYALRDADAFYNFLVYTRGVSPTRTSLLTSNPTASDIREALRQRAAEVGPGGTLWLYFAGHGAADPASGGRVLLGVDVQPKVSSLNETQTFNLAELDTIAAGSPAAQVVAVVDACYTGTGRDGKVLLEGKRIAVPAYAHTAHPKVVTWNAAGPSETSGPFEGAEHGLFTYFVVGALRGWADGEFDGNPDGTVTLGEARQFVYDAVRTVGGGEQNPVLEGTVDENSQFVRGTGLEGRPDLAAIVTEARGGVPEAEKPPAVTGGATPAAGGDFAARLAELTRLRQEREAAEARERELMAQVEAEQNARIEAVAGPIKQMASRSWQQTVLMLDGGGAEATVAARMYVETFGAATVEIDGQQVPVKIPEVEQARAWLVEHEGGARPAPVPVQQVVEDAPPVVTVDPLSLYNELSTHPLWEVPYGSEKLAKKLSKKLSRDSYNDELWGDAGDAANLKGNTDLATFFYLHALDIDPTDAEWGARLEELGLPSARAAAMAQRLRIDPSSDEVWGDFGDALVVDGEPAGACAAYNQALAIDPADSEWPGKIAENACAGMSGARGGAVAAAKRDLDADPNNDERIGDYADALMAAGQVNEACSHYRRALDLDPGDSEWPGKLMGCLETGLVVPTSRPASSGASPEALLSRIEASRRDLGSVIGPVRMDLTNDEAWGDLGDALGDDPLAADVFAVAMRIDPADSEWQPKLISHGGYDRAFAVFEEVLAADPSNDERLGDYGDRLAEAGRTADACNAYRAALRFDPGDSEWPGKVASCEGGAAPAPAAGDLPADSGNAVLDQAAASLRADPGNDERWGDWGDALSDQGRRSEACEAWHRANTLDPADSEWTGKLSSNGCGGSVAGSEDLALNDEQMGDLGDERMGSGDVAGACQAYEAALDADPGDGEWQSKTLACLLQLDPRGDEAIGDLGDRLASHGQMAPACAAYREALRIDHDDSEWQERRKDCRGVE